MNGKLSQGLLLSYVGLPSAWAEGEYAEIPFAVEKRLDKALSVIKDNTVGGVLYLTGDGGQVTKKLLDNFVSLTDLKGIDFAQYFQNKFSKEPTASELLAKKYTFVYNVGIEEALKKDYSAQILKSIIKRVTDQNCWVFLVSEVSKTDFERDYGIHIEHSIRLPNKPQVELF